MGNGASRRRNITQLLQHATEGQAVTVDGCLRFYDLGAHARDDRSGETFGLTAGLGLEADVHFGALNKGLAVGGDTHSDVVVPGWGFAEVHLVGPLCWTGRMTGVERSGGSVECRFLWISLVLV